MFLTGGDQKCSISNANPYGVVIERQTLISECIVNYGGNLVPYMRWHGPESFEQYQVNTSTAAYSSMIIETDRSMDQGSWRSVVNFTAPLTPPAAEAATNAPDFEMTYKTPTITVQCEYHG